MGGCSTTLKAWTLDSKAEIDGKYDHDFRKKAAANAAEIVDNLSAKLSRLAEDKANALDPKEAITKEATG